MKNYCFNLFVGSQLHGEGFGFGQNAIEAFETAIDQGAVYIPENTEIEVSAVNTANGLMIRFDVYKGQ